MSVTSVACIVGWALVMLASAMVLPALAAVGYGESRSAEGFALAALLTGFVAGLLLLANRGARASATKRENVSAVVAVALATPVFAALPMLMAGAVSAPVDAYFESVSGLTTSGATVFESVEAADRAVLLWRAQLQWLGGVATVVIVILHLAHFGVGGLQVHASAIVHGEQDPTMTRLRETGAAVVTVYAALAGMCSFALLAAGLPPFDAIAHALSAVSTGGFSTRDGSVGAFGNPFAEAVLIVFMLLGATGASLHWLLPRHRGLHGYLRDPEFLRMLGLAAVAAVAFAVALVALADRTAAEAVRHGLFQAVSALTTTGFTTGDRTAWPLSATALLLLLMLVGGCSGSTAGGLKIMRLVLLARLGRREMLRLAHPHGVRPVRYGGMAVDTDTARGVWALFVVSAFALGVLILALTATGASLPDATFAAAAALSNTAPMAPAAPPLAEATTMAKLTMCLGMILGRMEYFTVLILLNPLFWRR